MKKFFIGVALFTAGAVGGWHLNCHRSSGLEIGKHIFTDTITVYDTCRVEVKTPVDSIPLRYITRYLPIASPITDSINATAVDSVPVQLPIMRKVYADSTYRAVVSGYEPHLDSLTIFSPVTTVSKSVVVRDKPSRWGISITAGAAMTPRGIRPSVSVGISYSLATF